MLKFLSIYTVPKPLKCTTFNLTLLVGDEDELFN